MFFIVGKMLQQNVKNTIIIWVDFKNSPTWISVVHLRTENFTIFLKSQVLKASAQLEYFNQVCSSKVKDI